MAGPRVGLSAYDIDPCDLVDLAVAADELGFSSLWLGEHVVLPIGYDSTHPARGGHDTRSRPIVDPATRLVDPLVALAGCAVATRSIRLATGIFLLPLRPPVVTARMVHTLQGLSRGRFVLGVGAGWLEEEFDAVGVPFAGRGERLEENLAVLRAALAGGPVHHDGPLHRLDGVQLCVEETPVSVVLGGNSDRALRRAARLADGWFCSGTPDLTDAVRHRRRVLDLHAATGRAGPFSVHVRVPRAEPDMLARYAEEGFDETVVWADQVWPPGADLAAKRAALAAAAAGLGVTAPPEPAPPTGGTR